MWSWLGDIVFIYRSVAFFHQDSRSDQEQQKKTNWEKGYGDVNVTAEVQNAS